MDAKTLDVPAVLRRTAQPTEADWIDSARRSIDLLADVRGAPDLASTRVLDVGCGTKLVKVLLDEDRPIRRYVGIDVEPDVVSFLRTNVADPRFRFEHIDVYNELYNPRGTALADYSALPIDGETFDIICLFSVFTHLAPPDYRAMLEVLRPHAAEDCRLVFSLYVNRHADPTTALASLIDDDAKRRIEAVLQARLDAGEQIEVPSAHSGLDAGTATAGTADVPDYVELIPDQPLLAAAYSEAHARSLIEGSGWRALDLHPPEGYIQHYFVCAPD
jgi:SAM-dependent methyltransferase